MEQANKDFTDDRDSKKFSTIIAGLNNSANEKFDKFAEEAKEKLSAARGSLNEMGERTKEKLSAAGTKLGNIGRETKEKLSAAAFATGKAANKVGDSIADSVSGAASEATHVLGLSFNTLAQNTQYKIGKDIGKGIAAKVAAQSKKDADAKAAARSKMPEMAQSDDKAAKELSQQRLQKRLNDPIINPKLNPEVAAQPKVAAAAKSGAAAKVAEQGQPKGAEVYKYIYYRSPNGTIFKFGIFKDVPQFPNKILIVLSREQNIGSESSTGKFMIDLQKKNIPEASVSQASSSHIAITLHLNQPQFDLLQTAADNNRQWTLTPANVANAPITFPGTWHSDENSAMKKEKLSEAAASESNLFTVLWVDETNHSLGVTLTKENRNKLTLKEGDFIFFKGFEDGVVIREFQNPSGRTYHKERPVYMTFTPWINIEGAWGKTELFSKCFQSETQLGPNEVSIDWNTVEIGNDKKPVAILPRPKEDVAKASQADVDPLTGKLLTRSDASSPPQSPGPTSVSTKMEYTNVLILDERTTKSKVFKQARSRNATIKLSTDKKITITFTGSDQNIELNLSVLSTQKYDNNSPGCRGNPRRNTDIRSAGYNAKCLNINIPQSTESLSSPFTIQFQTTDDCDKFKDAVETFRSGRTVVTKPYKTSTLSPLFGKDEDDDDFDKKIGSPPRTGPNTSMSPRPNPNRPLFTYDYDDDDPRFKPALPPGPAPPKPVKLIEPNSLDNSENIKKYKKMFTRYTYVGFNDELSKLNYDAKKDLSYDYNGHKQTIATFVDSSDFTNMTTTATQVLKIIDKKANQEDSESKITLINNLYTTLQPYMKEADTIIQVLRIANGLQNSDMNAVDRGGKRRRFTIKKNRRSIRRTTIRRRLYKNKNKKNRSFKR